MSPEQIKGRLTILRATLLQVAEEATFLGNELGRVYGSAPKKGMTKSTEDQKAQVLYKFKKSFNKNKKTSAETLA